MDDQRWWNDRFTIAAETDRGATDHDVADDIARGRRRLRRRQGLAAGVTALAVTSVVGLTMFVSSFGAGTQTAPQVAAPGDPSPAESEAPSLTPSQSPRSPSPTLPPSEGPPVNEDNAFDTLESTKEWRNGVYDVTASVLDPRKRHLDYSTQGLQSGSWTTGQMHMGIKMGWSVPGRAGEGMVQVMISNERPQDAIGCLEFVGDQCTEVVAKTGEHYQVGRGEPGEFLVIYEQPDGERVFVYVNPLFGNNSLEPVGDMAVSEWDAVRLAMDDRLNLPAS